jgi:hypothetical protein
MIDNRKLTQGRAFQIILSISLLMLVGCTSTISVLASPISDGGLLVSKSNCALPCFLGIIPGVTTIEQVKKILVENNYDNCDYNGNEKMGDITSITCSPGPYIGFQQGKDIVEIISFIPSTKISVDDVVERHGYPTAVSVMVEGTNRGAPYSSMFLYYDELLTILYVGKQEGEKFTLSPDLSILSVNYNAPSFYDFKRNAQDLELWKGYGEYNSLPYIG